MTDAYSFAFDDKDVVAIDEQAKTFKKEYTESSGSGEASPKVVFLQEGHHTFRFYPDRDKNGMARIVKRIWIHRGLQINPKRKVWIWEDDRVNGLISELQKEGMENLLGKPIWQWYSQELGLACIHMFDTQDQEWHPVGSTVIVMLDKRQIFSIQDFISELHPEEKRKLLDPNTDGLGIKISVTKAGAKSNTSVGVTMRMLALPMPPQMTTQDPNVRLPFEGLDKVYIQETDKLEQADWEEFRKNVYSELEKWKAQKGQAADATGAGADFSKKDGPGPNPGTTPDVNPNKSESNSSTPVKTETSSASNVTSSVTCPLAEKIKIKPEMVNDYGPDVRFGSHPTKNNPYCVICEHEEQCIEVTVKGRTTGKAA
jgi:hypothetical protein